LRLEIFKLTAVFQTARWTRVRASISPYVFFLQEKEVFLKTKLFSFFLLSNGFSSFDFMGGGGGGAAAAEAFLAMENGGGEGKGIFL